MRISDWSSDVCSSDLCALGLERRAVRNPAPEHGRTDQELRAGTARRRRGGIGQLARRRLLCERPDQIGRASCRESVCQYGVDLGGRRIIKKKNNTIYI